MLYIYHVTKADSCMSHSRFPIKDLDSTPSLPLFVFHTCLSSDFLTLFPLPPVCAFPLIPPSSSSSFVSLPSSSKHSCLFLMLSLIPPHEGSQLDLLWVLPFKWILTQQLLISCYLFFALFHLSVHPFIPGPGFMTGLSADINQLR